MVYVLEIYLQLIQQFLNQHGNAVEICIQLLGTICLWNGIMRIAEKTSIITKLKKILKPIIKILFPDIKDDEEAYTAISMNVVANVMGLRKCSYTYGVTGNAGASKKE